MAFPKQPSPRAEILHTKRESASEISRYYSVVKPAPKAVSRLYCYLIIFYNLLYIYTPALIEIFHATMNLFLNWNEMKRLPSAKQ